MKPRPTAARVASAWCVAAMMALSATFAAAAPALAGPPFQTDDPEPTPYHGFEIYAFSQYQRQFDSVSGSLPAFEVQYGAAPNVQVGVAAGLAESRSSASAPWMAGYGDTQFGVKVRFVQESSRRPQVAFYPSVVVPTGQAKNGLGGGFTKYFLPLWAQKSIGRWTIFGGGGLWHNPGPGNRDYTFSGIAAQREATRTMSYGVELFHATADTIGGRPSTGFSAGLARSVDKHHQVVFSIGRSLGTSSTASMYAGYKLSLGAEDR